MTAPLRERRTASNLTWRIDRKLGQTVVELQGRVDEPAELEPLRAELRGPVMFRLAKIQAINSTGVREWINLIRDLPAVTELVLSGCSIAIVTQINMVSNFVGKGRVESVYAPYMCGGCATEAEQLVPIHTRGMLKPPVFA